MDKVQDRDREYDARRKRIMVVTPRFPLPLIGGDRIRIYNICRELSQSYDLDLFSLTHSDEDDITVVEPEVFQNVERFRMNKWRSIAGVGASILRGAPMQIGYFNHSAMRKRIAVVADRYDAILGHLIRVVPMLPSDQNIPTIIEMTDAISLNFQRVAQHRKLRSIRSILYSLDELRTFQYELRCVRDADVASIISKIDAHHLFEENIPGNVVIAGNGVSIENYPQSDVSDTKEILFLGNMDTEQNLDAVQYMADEVMTQLVDEGYTLRVVGTISEANAMDLRRRCGVVLTGRVPVLATAVAGCSIAVAPMRIGAGVQNKVLEYMAFGIPSVISSIAAEGLEIENGVHAIIADTPTEIATTIRRLCDNKLLRDQLAARGRALVEERYTWRAALAPLSAAITGLFRQ